GSVFISELTASCGRKDISIIGCELMNVVRSFPRSSITSGRIRWLLGYAPEPKTGAGLLIHTDAMKADRLVLKTTPVDSPKAHISDGEAAFLCQRVEDNAFHL